MAIALVKPQDILAETSGVDVTKFRPTSTTGIDPALVKRYPTRLAVRCQNCRHQGTVSVFLDKAPKLVCSKCGNRDPIVQDRDPNRRHRPGLKKPERSYGTAFSG